MPQIVTIRVTRRRSVQPEQFGNAAAEVELTGNVLEGEDYKDVARQMLNTSRALVYENLGMKLPKNLLDTTAEVDTPTETAKVETITKDDTKAEEPKKKPGRPKGSGKKATEAKPATDTNTEEDEIPSDDDVVSVTPNDDSDIPDDDDEPQPNIRTNPEDRNDPEDDGIPEDDDVSSEENTGGMTAAELNSWFNSQIPDKLNPARAKEILAGLGVARLRDLDTQEKVNAAEKIIKDAIAGK